MLSKKQEKRLLAGGKLEKSVLECFSIPVNVGSTEMITR